MKISICIPFAESAPETGLILLLANYLRAGGHEIISCSFDGGFPVSSFGGSMDWRKSLTSLELWMREQRELAKWSGIKYTGISEYLMPEDVLKTHKWLNLIPKEELFRAFYKGFDVYAACKITVSEKCGTKTPDLEVNENEAFIKNLILAAVRIYVATDSFNSYHNPAMSFIAGGQDFVTASFYAKCKRQGVNCVVFRWDLKEKCIKIVRPKDQAEFSSDYILDDVTKMRPDIKTWPEEILNMCSNILRFLDIPSEQTKIAAVN